MPKRDASGPRTIFRQERDFDNTTDCVMMS